MDNVVPLSHFNVLNRLTAGSQLEGFIVRLRDMHLAIAFSDVYANFNSIVRGTKTALKLYAQWERF